MKKRHIAGLIILVLWVMILIESNMPPDRNKLPDFPKPDPTQGTPWGYNFQKGDYRYQTEYQGESIPLRETYTNPNEMTEDDARDLLDYTRD